MKPILRTFYNAVITAALPAILARLWIKGFKDPRYRQRIHERLGRPNASIDPDQPLMWFHAASLGEVNALKPLVEAFQTAHPDYQIVLTTMTPTGSHQAQTLFKDSVYHWYVPYDTPVAVRRFLKRVQPNMLVIMETELWPNLIVKAAQYGPVAMVNARLSPKSVRSYQRVKWLFQPIFQTIQWVAVQSDLDAERFQQIGFAQRQIHALGNMKFDLTVDANIKDKALAFRQTALKGRLVWVAGSTHEGEETHVLKAHQHLQSSYPNALLLLVPRHPQRFDQVAQTVTQAGLTLARRSDNTALNDRIDVLLVDQMGALVFMYACADAAFIGGSLVGHGGHNPLEAVAVDCPVLSGPNVWHFSAIFEALQAVGGVKMIDNARALAAAIDKLIHSPDTARAMKAQAKGVLKANQGAVKQQLVKIEQSLSDDA